MEKLNLEEMGLTAVEAKVYTELLKLGSTTTGPLVKKTELHRATVYDALKRLMEKGLASFIVKEKTRHFQAASPDRFLDIVEEEKRRLESKENAVKGMVKKMENIREQAKSMESAGIFQGKRGIKTVFEDVLNCRDICSFASKGKFGEILGPYFYQFQKKKKQKRIRDRILINKELKGTGYVKSIYGQVRFLPKDYEYPTATMVYGNKTAIFVFTEYPMAFVIESREVANSYRSYFEILWDKAIHP